MKKHRLVRQQNEWGCGVACTASLLGISYKGAMAEVQIAAAANIDFSLEGLELEIIISVLQQHGLSVSVRTDLKRWPIGTIAFLSEKEGAYKGSGHYILKTKEGWMDPYFNALTRGEKESRKARCRSRLPRNTFVQVALVPLSQPSCPFKTNPL
ncbi:cysteine peptidase family C39 domain-containing protein [Xanthomonas euroxanthea]|uniref:cysteine peptidase family C39 domain-containing protein n=1 Tax=Xanthomonas euroxanthea TaxID=2259622 RepID=UPI001611C2A1